GPRVQEGLASWATAMVKVCRSGDGLSRREDQPQEGMVTAMPHLVTIVLWALLVGNALRPPRLGARAGFVVYVLGMTINELPLLFLVLVSAGVVSTLVTGAPPDGMGGVAWSV